MTYSIQVASVADAPRVDIGLHQEEIFDPQFSAITTANGRLELTLVNGSDEVVIEASTNLVDWFEVVPSVAETNRLEITMPLNTPAQFFRAVQN